MPPPDADDRAGWSGRSATSTRPCPSSSGAVLAAHDDGAGPATLTGTRGPALLLGPGRLSAALCASASRTMRSLAIWSRWWDSHDPVAALFRARVTPAARLAAVIEVLDTDRAPKRRPGRRGAEGLGPGHRFAGSGDRRAIAERTYRTSCAARPRSPGASGWAESGPSALALQLAGLRGRARPGRTLFSHRRAAGRRLPSPSEEQSAAGRAAGEARPVRAAPACRRLRRRGRCAASYRRLTGPTRPRALVRPSRRSTCASTPCAAASTRAAPPALAHEELEACARLSVGLGPAACRPLSR